MPEAFHERRRTPRVTVAAGHELHMPLSMTVQLIDIGLGGVLMALSQAAEPGQRASLQTRLNAEPVQAEVEVCRVGPERSGVPGPGRFRAGARFVSLDETSRRSIQRFLREEVS